jgi:hypothetical protein
MAYKEHTLMEPPVQLDMSADDFPPDGTPLSEPSAPLRAARADSPVSGQAKGHPPKDWVWVRIGWLKRTAVWSSLLAFLALLGLASRHVTGSANNSTHGNNQTSGSQQNGGFFGSGSSGVSYGSGNGASQRPITNSGVS